MIILNRSALASSRDGLFTHRPGCLQVAAHTLSHWLDRCIRTVAGNYPYHRCNPTLGTRETSNSGNGPR